MTQTQFERALRGFCRRRPFRQFVIELENGRDVTITHPEAVRREGDLFIFREPDGRHVFFAAVGVTRLLDPPATSAN